MIANKDFLYSIPEDGILYAHFFTHPLYAGYYGVLVRERTPEYISHWLPTSGLNEFSLALSFAMPDTSFCDFLDEQYPDQEIANYLKKLYRIKQFLTAEEWCHNFKTWKQEKIRLNRVKWLEQYPWTLSHAEENRAINIY